MNINNLRVLLGFERMLTPVILKILYWIAIALSILWAIGFFISMISGAILALASGEFLSAIGGLFLTFIGTPIVLVISLIVVRVYAELLILAFQINDTLTDIKKLLEREKV